MGSGFATGGFASAATGFSTTTGFGLAA